ncbi:hypothetical protein ABKN59_002717 [Abortiporus biennis]
MSTLSMDMKRTWTRISSESFKTPSVQTTLLLARVLIVLINPTFYRTSTHQPINGQKSLDSKVYLLSDAPIQLEGKGETVAYILGHLSMFRRSPSEL